MKEASPRPSGRSRPVPPWSSTASRPRRCSTPSAPGIRRKLPEEITHGDYPAVVELLIAAGSRPRKRMLFGSDAVKEVLRRHGVPDGE